MAIKKIDKYADYRYEIESETELEEAKWLIEIGTFKDMDDYIDRMTRAETRRFKRADAEKLKRAKSRKRAKAA